MRGLAWLLGGLVYQFDQRGRAYAQANLEMAFGGEKRPEEIRKIGRDSYRQFARSMLELFWARNFTAENYPQRMVMEGWDEARALNRQHHGGIFVCLHYGNFEWLSIAGSFERLPGCIVTQRFRNPLLGPIFDQLRAMSGHRIVPQERSMLVTLKHLKAGGNIGVLIDLQLDPRLPSVPIKSFGRWCSVTKLHAVLQKRTGLPLFRSRACPWRTDATARSRTRLCTSGRRRPTRKSPSSAGMPLRHRCGVSPRGGSGPTSTGGIFPRGGRGALSVLCRPQRRLCRDAQSGVCPRRGPGRG